MRRSPILLGIALIAASATPAILRAETLDHDRALAHARLELELAKRDARCYWQIEYPLQRRELTAAIDLTQAEIRRDKRLLREYRRLNHFTYGNPLTYSVEDLQICLREAELRLNGLLQERINLRQFHADEARLYELRVLEARRRLIDLQGGGVIAIAVPETAE